MIWWKRMLTTLCFTLVASLAPAKPLGICGEVDNLAALPSWASFASITDLPWANYERAANFSRATGFRWVLGIFAPPVGVPIRDHLVTVRARTDAAGLTPFIIATYYGEEWYERIRAGEIAASIDAAHAFLGAQHAALKAAYPSAYVVWLTTFVNNDRARYGEAYYQPEPAYTDLIALDTYVTATGTFASDVEPYLQHALVTTSTPIVLVPQWFVAPADPQWSRGPTADSLAGYARWAAHPRVVATWGFTWESRAGLSGLGDLPATRLAVERSLGVAP